MIQQLRKVWSDVVRGGTRSLITVFALALGVWGLGSVFVSARILGPDLKQNFDGTVPPHAIVTLTESNGTLPAWPSSVTAEFRDLKLLRVQVHPDEWIPLWLFAVEDFSRQRLARVVPEGTATPSPGSFAIERNGLLISDLRVGSKALVRSGDRNLEVPVSSLVFDPAQAPATQDHFIYAYTDPATWTALTGQPSQRRLLLRFDGVVSRADVLAVVKDLELPKGASVVVPAFEEHPHQWQLDLLLGIIGSVGLLAFLLSAVLVSQVVGALLSRQTRQVGVLKALGASPFRVIALYTLYLTTLALAAGLISVPLSLATGRAFASFVAAILNFEILTTELSLETLVLVAVALALPFLFAGPALLRAGVISVRQALADASVTPNPVPTRLPWAVRNLLSRPGRTLITVAAITLGVGIFSTGFNVRESLAQFLATTRDAMRFDLQVVVSEPVPRDRLVAPFELPGVAATELWVGGRGRIQSLVAGAQGELGVVALPFDTTMATPRLLDGRWLQDARAPEVVVNQLALVELGRPSLGQRIRLNLGGEQREVSVVGVAEEIDTAKVYLSEELWAQWVDPLRQANTLSLVALDRSYEGVMALKKAVERAGAASDLKILYVVSQAERTKIIADHLDIILFVLLVLAFLVLGVAALGSAAASSISVMERTREIGVLRAMGAGPRRIVGLFVTEGVVSALLGLLFGLLLAWPLSLAASAFFGTLMLGEGAELRYAWNPAGTVITAVVTLVFGWWASRSPARAATRIPTREALSYE